MKADIVKLTLAERKAQLIVACGQQRRHMSNEIAILRAPSVLTGGSIISSLTSGRFKIPLAIAGMVMGVIASRSGAGAVPLLSTGMSLFRMAQSLYFTIKAKTA